MGTEGMEGEGVKDMWGRHTGAQRGWESWEAGTKPRWVGRRTS